LTFVNIGPRETTVTNCSFNNNRSGLSIADQDYPLTDWDYPTIYQMITLYFHVTI